MPTGTDWLCGILGMLPVAGDALTVLKLGADQVAEERLESVRVKYGWDIQAIPGNQYDARNWVRKKGGMAFIVEPKIGTAWYWKPDKDFKNDGLKGYWYGIIRATTEKPDAPIDNHWEIKQRYFNKATVYQCLHY